MAELFHLHLGCSREEECLHCVESFAKAGWKQRCLGSRLWGSGTTYSTLANLLSALQKSMSSASGCSTRLTRECWSPFTFSKDVGRKKTILAAGGASLKRGGSCGVRKWAVASLLSSTSQRSPLSARKLHYGSLELYGS